MRVFAKRATFWMLTNIIQIRKTRNIHFWMLTNIIQIWKTRNIHFWMNIAQIPHYREMHNNHPLLDDYCFSSIIIHF